MPNNLTDIYLRWSGKTVLGLNCYMDTHTTPRQRRDPFKCVDHHYPTTHHLLLKGQARGCGEIFEIVSIDKKRKEQLRKLIWISKWNFFFRRTKVEFVDLHRAAAEDVIPGCLGKSPPESPHHHLQTRKWFNSHYAGNSLLIFWSDPRRWWILGPKEVEEYRFRWVVNRQWLSWLLAGDEVEAHYPGIIQFSCPNRGEEHEAHWPLVFYVFRAINRFQRIVSFGSQWIRRRRVQV